ncbi:hypothetical protein GCK32_005012 [Trichostrongylus colubriformis]|uniref:Uncharacterized protein n=1 Tax=Trichostrongylus colubriformis TaxID=6319 RepID=A0AAN8ILV2_TRICO
MVCDATEQWSDTIKRLLKDLSEQSREPYASAANKKSKAKPDRKAMHMYTKALNESVTVDKEDLSTRFGKPSPHVVVQATDSKVAEEQCNGKQLYIHAFLPHILDCQAKCRNKFLDILRGLGHLFKKNGWGWIWVEGGSQSDLEKALGVGGFGYPAMVALNYSKVKL